MLDKWALSKPEGKTKGSKQDRMVRKELEEVEPRVPAQEEEGWLEDGQISLPIKGLHLIRALGQLV